VLGGNKAGESGRISFRTLGTTGVGRLERLVGKIEERLERLEGGGDFLFFLRQVLQTFASCGREEREEMGRSVVFFELQRIPLLFGNLM
jgi:hypothetical protein